MIVCVAVDDNMGMMFNNRRQSQDKILRKYLLNMVNGRKIWINNYTAKQFEYPLTGNIAVDENFLDKACEEDFCFVENLSLEKYKERIKEIILFKWNRIYPADMYFDIPLVENEWKLTYVDEFEGNSHEKITMEEWKRESI